MDLIIKVTERCNFACTFCSSPNIAANSDSTELDINKIFQFLDRYPETNTIIMNGGDPLLRKPEFYWDIIEYLDFKGMDKTTLAFTTNLWDFYKKPDKWTELFSHERVGVTTSFNYGETRRISKSRNFSEEEFLKVSDLFLERIGYRPDFISVITEENADTAVDNVRLAKKLGVECKLNWAMASGRASKPYPIGKMYKIYAEIYKEGLTEWEHNTKEILGKKNGKNAVCPLNRECQKGIRNLQPDGYGTCGAFGDDHEYEVDFDKEMAGAKIDPFPKKDFLALKEECLTCPGYQYCHGCKKVMTDLRRHDLIEVSCKAMKEAWKILGQ